jgi:RNA polymerase sigma-70 factor, ECF subfamily
VPPPSGEYGPPISVGAGDDQLVSAARAGDRDALDALLRRHYDRIHALCRRMTGNEADALDAAQEALIAVAKGLHRFDGRAAFGTWVYRVATNACLDELRRRRRRPEPGLDDDLSDPPQRDHHLDATPTRVDLDAALARLPEAYRAPVVLRDLCGLDYAEIGDVLGLPGGTVRSRIARGRSQLARLLDVTEPDPGHGASNR